MVILVTLITTLYWQILKNDFNAMIFLVCGIFCAQYNIIFNHCIYDDIDHLCLVITCVLLSPHHAQLTPGSTV